MRNAIEDAKRIIEKYYPDCEGAIVAGSVIRGGGTETSDLDIIIFDSRFENGFRESVISEGWPIEFFCHNEASFDFYMNKDRSEGTPSLQNMVIEGIVIKDHPYLQIVKRKASMQLQEGPQAWNDFQVRMKRYFITDALDDFIGSENERETICIANLLYERLHEFYLGVNRRWIGHGKWMYRAMMRYDSEMAERLYSSFDDFYKEGKKENIVKICDIILEPHGGRLFEGFKIGKK